MAAAPQPSSGTPYDGNWKGTANGSGRYVIGFACSDAEVTLTIRDGRVTQGAFKPVIGPNAGRQYAVAGGIDASGTFVGTMDTTFVSAPVKGNRIVLSFFRPPCYYTLTLNHSS